MDDEQLNEKSEGGHPAVVAYRMGVVESEIAKLGAKMDTIITLYPTEARVMQMLRPMEDDIIEIKRNKERENQQKATYQGQLRIALAAAILSPVVSVLITLLVVSNNAK